MYLQVAEIIGNDIVHHVLPNAHLEASKNHSENDTEHHRRDGNHASPLIPPNISPRELEHYCTSFMLLRSKNPAEKVGLKSNFL